MAVSSGDHKVTLWKESIDKPGEWVPPLPLLGFGVWGLGFGVRAIVRFTVRIVVWVRIRFKVRVKVRLRVRVCPYTHTSKTRRENTRQGYATTKTKTKTKIKTNTIAASSRCLTLPLFCPVE